MKTPFFWIDLEMTGLDDARDSILEVAVVLTDMNFQTLKEYQQVVYQPEDVLANMNDWCKKHHGESGLTAEVPNGKPLASVEKDLLALIDAHYPKNEKVVLVGNSIHNDRRFIDRWMPEFAKRLHYRLIDVSSFKEVYRNRYGIKFEKKNTHRATADIYESIRELAHYLSFVTIKAEDEK